MSALRLRSPFSAAAVASLRAGQEVLIDGVLYTARDAAHRRFVAALDAGQPLPFDIRGQTLYYVGPSPAPPGRASGAAGPTTSGRMDIYTPRLLELGLRAMIGKGGRSKELREAMVKHKAVYLAAIGGAGALLALAIKRAEVVAYPELGPEAVRRLEVEGFPALVINDTHGADWYEEGRGRWRRGGG
ncbi:MAG: fumarate hydratase C-terminal domain-containing protein [Chloroflexi bacterium]|nr:fumarate hydratase C-terminal domain-containing protein [Chloroflexota bacterium]